MFKEYFKSIIYLNKKKTFESLLSNYLKNKSKNLCLSIKKSDVTIVDKVGQHCFKAATTIFIPLLYAGSPLSPGNRLGSPVKGGNGKTVVVLKASSSPLRPGLNLYLLQQLFKKARPFSKRK